MLLPLRRLGPYLAEMVGAFALVFAGCGAIVVDAVSHGQVTHVGVAIGGTVLLDAMFGSPISGASMNPARSFGPALVSGTWAHLWLYMLGPVIGAVLGALIYELGRGERPEPGLPSGGRE